MFEQTHRSSCDSFGSGSVTAFPEDSAQTVYDAARSLIIGGLSTDENIVTIDGLSLYEVRGIRNLYLIPPERFAVERQEGVADGKSGTRANEEGFDHPLSP